MDFKDPFADDLRNFNSNSSAVPRGRPAASGAGTLGGEAPLRNRGGTSIFHTPTDTLGSLGPSTTPSLGRPGVESPFMDSLGALTRSSTPQQGGHAPIVGRRGVIPPPAAPASGVTWLDSGALPLPVSLGPSAPAATSHVAAAQRATSSADDFLDFLENPDAKRTAPPRGGGGGGGGVSPSVAAAPQPAPVDPAIAIREAERQKELAERRELLSTLAALEAEEAKVTQRIETKEIQEEAELLKLETTLIEKQMELEEKTKEKENKIKETKEYAERRIQDMTLRHEEERASLREEMKGTEKEKYLRQLKQLHTNYETTTESLRTLRQQRALLIQEDAFGEHGIRLQLSSAIEDSLLNRRNKTEEEEEENSEEGTSRGGSSNASPQGSAGGHDESDRERQQEADDPSHPAPLEPEAEVELAMDAALTVIQRYVDDRLTTARNGVVDYVHASTLEAAHEVQRNRARGWTEDAMQRKEELGAYIREMMDRFLYFYRERGELKGKNLTMVREGMSNAAQQFREAARDRLARLLEDLQTKLKVSTDSFDAKTRENFGLLERSAAATREGDYHVAEAQMTEAKQRCLVESNVRRQLYESQLDSLRRQLAKIRHQGDLLSQEQTKELFQRSLEAGSVVERVREGVSLLAASVEADAAAVLKRDTFTTSAPEAEAARLRREEVEHTLAVLLETTQQQSGNISRDRATYHRQLEEFLHTLEESLVDAIGERCLMRQAEGARLDHIRLTWEKEHRHHLMTPQEFEVMVPNLEPGGKSVVGVSTITSPFEATLTTVLEAVAATLKERDAAHRRLRRTRQGQLTLYEKEIERLIAHSRSLAKEWQRYGEQLDELEEDQRRLMKATRESTGEEAKLYAVKESLSERTKDLNLRRRHLEREVQQSALESERVKAAYAEQQRLLREATEERLHEVHRLYTTTTIDARTASQKRKPHRYTSRAAPPHGEEYQYTPPRPYPTTDSSSKSGTSTSKSPLQRKKTAIAQSQALLQRQDRVNVSDNSPNEKDPVPCQHRHREIARSLTAPPMTEDSPYELEESAITNCSDDYTPQSQETSPLPSREYSPHERHTAAAYDPPRRGEEAPDAGTPSPFRTSTAFTDLLSIMETTTCTTSS